MEFRFAFFRGDLELLLLFDVPFDIMRTPEFKKIRVDEIQTNFTLRSWRFQGVTIADWRGFGQLKKLISSNFHHYLHHRGPGLTDLHGIHRS